MSGSVRYYIEHGGLMGSGFFADVIASKDEGDKIRLITAKMGPSNDLTKLKKYVKKFAKREGVGELMELPL